MKLPAEAGCKAGTPGRLGGVVLSPDSHCVPPGASLIAAAFRALWGAKTRACETSRRHRGCERSWRGLRCSLLWRGLWRGQRPWLSSLSLAPLQMLLEITLLVLVVRQPLDGLPVDGNKDGITACASPACWQLVSMVLAVMVFHLCVCTRRHGRHAVRTALAKQLANNFAVGRSLHVCRPLSW